MGVTEEPASPAGRICFVTDHLVRDVSDEVTGTHLVLMGRLLAQRGWDVEVLVCGAADKENATATALGAQKGISLTWLEEAPAPTWAKITSIGDGTPGLVASQRAFEVLEALHAQHPYDIIEFSDCQALGFRAVQAKRSALAFADTRLAVKLQGATEWQRRSNSRHLASPWELKVEYCERYAFEKADLQISPSQYMLADSRGRGWNVREDAVVAYPFPSRQVEVRSRGNHIEELVFFGRLEPRGGLDLFLAALDTLPPELPVLFLGRDSIIEAGSTTDVIAERLNQRPHRIESALSRDAALAELSRGDRLVVMASHTETHGFPVAECIANEIPFLAAHAGGIPELVVHEEARRRWLFAPTAEGLVGALGRRLAAPADEERELRSVVATACDPDAWNDRLEATYRELAVRPTRRSRAPTRAAATVAVAVTHYNHPAFLATALASLAAQTRPPDEVFVLDDGSSEEDARRVFADQKTKYPGWTFLHAQNGGPGAARNACLARAKSDFFLPFDSDNVASPLLVETLLNAILEDDRDAATCQMLGFGEDDDIGAGRFAFRFAPTGGPRLLTVLENVFGDTCGMFRAQALRAVGGFETERWSPHEDWETYTKLAFAGFRVDAVPRVLLFYRTGIGGRLDRLAADPAQSYPLQQRMVHEILADAVLSHGDRAALWESLIGFAQLGNDLAALQQAHDELAEWAAQTLADAHEWREDQLEGLREWLTDKVDEATSRAERAEAELAELRARNADTEPSPTGRSPKRGSARRALGKPRAARVVATARRALRWERGR